MTVGWTKETIWRRHFGLAEIEMTISWHFTGCVHVFSSITHILCVCVCVCPTSLPWPSCLTHRADTHTPGCPVGRWKVSCPRSLHHLLLLTPDLPSQWGQPTNTPSSPQCTAILLFSSLLCINKDYKTWIIFLVLTFLNIFNIQDRRPVSLSQAFKHREAKQSYKSCFKPPQGPWLL